MCRRYISAFFEEGDQGVTVNGTTISTEGRAEIWLVVYNDALRSPIVGLGAGSATDLVTKRFGASIAQPHNDYLRIFHDYGLVGITLWVGFVTSLVLTLRHRYRVAKSQGEVTHQRAIIAALAGLLMVLFSMSTDNIIIYPGPMFLEAILLGNALGIRRKNERSLITNTRTILRPSFPIIISVHEIGVPLRRNHQNLRILIVGQTPPPFGGQAVMIQLLLDGAYPGVDLHHVRMDLSRDLGSTGKWQLGKLWRLIQVVAKIYYAKLLWRPDVLYYPPCGPGFLPVARDIALLCATRFLFRSTIFHFHASGLTEYSERLHPLMKVMFDLAYGQPDVAIRLSKMAPAEGPNLHCKREYIIANGIRDAAGHSLIRNRDTKAAIQILFVALLTAEKGVLIVIEAINALLRQGADVQLTCVGGWESASLRTIAESLIDFAHKASFISPECWLTKRSGSNTGPRTSFAFPAFFHSETFPLVLLEAMAFSLPIVSTRWRGIPDVVEEGSNALLVEPMGCRLLYSCLIHHDKKSGTPCQNGPQLQKAVP